MTHAARKDSKRDGTWRKHHAVKAPSREPEQPQMSLDSWPCPTCLGARTMLTPNGLVACRVCHGTGRVPDDPHDHTVIPY